MTDRRIPPAGDPIHAAGRKARITPRTEAELAEAIHADERERDGFPRGFFGSDYAEEIRGLMVLGVEEPGGEANGS